MKVLLVLTMLFACSAACSEPAATPSWQRGAAARDPPGRSLRRGQGSPPAAPGRGASEAPAGASGRRGCAGLSAAGLSSAPAAGDEPGAAEAESPFCETISGLMAKARRRRRFPALASLLLGAFWLRGEDKNPPVKPRHGVRGGGAALI